MGRVKVLLGLFAFYGVSGNGFQIYGNVLFDTPWINWTRDIYFLVWVRVADWLTDVTAWLIGVLRSKASTQWTTPQGEIVDNFAHLKLLWGPPKLSCRCTAFIHLVFVDLVHGTHVDQVANYQVALTGSVCAIVADLPRLIISRHRHLEILKAANSIFFSRNFVHLRFFWGSYLCHSRHSEVIFTRLQSRVFSPSFIYTALGRAQSFCPYCYIPENREHYFLSCADFLIIVYFLLKLSPPSLWPSKHSIIRGWFFKTSPYRTCQICIAFHYWFAALSVISGILALVSKDLIWLS